MKQKVVVLGAGRVGKAIAADLSDDFAVISADVNHNALEFLSSHYGVNTRATDLGDSGAVREVIGDAALVVCAVLGKMGFNTLKTVIESGKDVVDISFFPEDAFELHELAVGRNVTALVDCGVAPGTPDFLTGFFAGQMQ